MKPLSCTLLFTALPLINAKCYEPSPAFPPPLWSSGPRHLAAVFKAIEEDVKAITKDQKYNTSSLSLEITSSTETLYSQFHTADVLNDTRPGDTNVDTDSLFRIASISKTFTTLGILHLQKAGNLSLEDPIIKHIPELGGELPWKDITLRILASQLSGIPRDWAQGDIINGPDPTSIGLPPASKDKLPNCDEYSGYERPCGREDLFRVLKEMKPIFAPNQKSTYSNIAFELLGLVIENIMGLNYTDYIQEAVFDPLDMASSSLQAPECDDHAVLPAIGFNYWDVDEGVQNPTGGIYSSSSDMSKFMRYLLTHFNTLATGVNWLLPSSWSTGMNTFYGMPFEIFRTDKILKASRRPVTFVTKSGGLPGYYSIMVLMEEYGLGLILLVAGKRTLLDEILKIVTVKLVQAAEDAIWRDVHEVYAGAYFATNTSLNSSLSLSSSPSTGLVLDAFTSNGTDVFATFLAKPGAWRAQLVPTLLYRNESAQQGEIWRMSIVNERAKHEEENVWDDFCTTDVDVGIYASLPANEVVFWHEEGVVELPAWQLVVERKGEGGRDDGNRLVMQE